MAQGLRGQHSNYFNPNKFEVFDMLLFIFLPTKILMMVELLCKFKSLFIILWQYLLSVNTVTSNCIQCAVPYAIMSLCIRILTISNTIQLFSNIKPHIHETFSVSFNCILQTYRGHPKSRIIKTKENVRRNSCKYVSENVVKIREIMS